MDNYNMPSPYMPDQNPSGNNQNIKTIVLIAAVTVVVVAAIVAFLIIFFFFFSRGSDGGKPETTATAAETTVAQTEAETTASMPDLKGMAKEKAIDKLAELGITAEISEIESDKEKAGNVLSHVPGKGGAVSKNDKVTLYIAKAPKTETTSKAESKTKTTAPPQSSRLAGGAVYLYCIAIDYVSLRTGPGVGYTEILRIPSRQSMVYLDEKSGSWYKVSYNGKTGYVSANYVSFDANAAINTKPDGSEQSQANRSYKTYSGDYLYCTASDFVSLRTGPDVSYTELARIPHGYSMKYLNKKSGNWYYVSYSGMTGYVSASWVTFDPDAV